MSAELRRAAALGTATGARTFLAPAALALRGRLGTAAKFALPAPAVGELVGDKLPTAPPRSQGAGLVGRVLSGAFSGYVTAGARGARVGAAFALAATYPSQTLRAEVVKGTPIPDLAYAVAEDLLAASIAWSASAEPRPDTPPPHQGVDGPKTPATVEFSAHRHEGSRGFVSLAGLGVAAALVGVGATAGAREWLDGFGGGEVSDGRRKAEGVGLLLVFAAAAATAYEAFAA
jgi:uncharacterized membrane protein